MRLVLDTNVVLDLVVFDDPGAGALRAAIEEKRATILGSAECLAELRDPKDIHVLACALAVRAETIVSGDADLHALGTFRGIPILSPSDFLKRFTA